MILYAAVGRAIALMVLAGVLSSTFAVERIGLSVEQIPVWRSDSSVIDLQDQSRQWTSNNSENQDSIQTSGYKTVRVVVGEGGSEVRQELRLQIQGEASPGWFVDGLIVDEGLGSSELRVSTLQDVDAMYLTLRHQHLALTLGDFQFDHTGTKLGGISHHSMGVLVDANTSHLRGRIALGQDPAVRRTSSISGVDGQRNGYLISGSGQFIAVVPGSESVWWLGRQLERGVDYRIEYVGGVLDFIGIRTPSSQDEIQIHFEEWIEDRSDRFTAMDLQGDWKRFSVRASMLGTHADSLPALGWQIWIAGLRTQPLSRLWLSSELMQTRQQSLLDSVLGAQEQGKAWTWRIATDSTWNSSQHFIQTEWESMWIQKGYSTTLSQGALQDWNAHDLQQNWELQNLDSLEAKRFDLVRLGFRPSSALRTWTEFGYRQGLNWNSRRTAWVGTHRAQEAESRVEFSQTEAYQSGEIRNRWQGRLDAKDQWKYWSPYTQGRFAMRQITGDNRMLDWELASGIKTSGFIFDQLTEEIRHVRISEDQQEHWQDSLWSSQWTQSFSVRTERLQWESLMQWGRQLIGYQSNLSQMLISEQNLNWESPAWDIRARHRMGMTAEQLFRPLYKRVEAGLGDVSWDSLTGEFIEGVDQGDFVRDGSIRDDSIPAVQTGELILEFEPWWNPALQFGISNGFLADISLGFLGMWQARDSTGLVWNPPWRDQDLEDLVDGETELSGRLRWSKSNGGAQALFSITRQAQRRGGSFPSAENSLRRQVELSWQLNPTLRLEGEGALEEVYRSLPEVMNWDLWSGIGRLNWEFAHHWSIAPRISIRQSQGVSLWNDLSAKLWQPGVRLHWNPYGQGSAQLEYVWTHVSSASEFLPYRILNGYTPGITHRVEASADYRLQEDISVTLRYVARYEESSEEIFQKLSAEARADF